MVEGNKREAKKGTKREAKRETREKVKEQLRNVTVINDAPLIKTQLRAWIKAKYF